MVHTSVLVNLRTVESDLVTYNPHNIPDYPGRGARDFVGYLHFLTDLLIY